MISLFLSIAMAQKLPNEIDASRTCGLISAYYQRQQREYEEKNRKLAKDCDETRKRLPKHLQKNVQCMNYYLGDEFMFVNSKRFYNECSAVLSKMDVKKHLFGPVRTEDYQVKPVSPNWGMSN